jgi:iron complex transport system substrate-binding protein
VTHECDYPAEAALKPRVTSSVIDSAGLSSRQIDQAVRDSLEQQATIYHLDSDLLCRLLPDLVLTQELCDVCAVGYEEVREVMASLPSRPRIVSLEPTTLNEVLDSILLVGREAGALRCAIEMRGRLSTRLDVVRAAMAGRDRVRVLTLEWVDPVFVGGHWVPDMVETAGGVDVLGVLGQPSREVTSDDVIRSAPDVIVAMPCGFGLERAKKELCSTGIPLEWRDLPAVRDDRVFVVDGSSYFNRPGPRLVDGVAILASILHPGACNEAPPHSLAHFDLSQSRSYA